MNDDCSLAAVETAADDLIFRETGSVKTPSIPAYLEETYSWAYLHPNAVRVFEREWLVNLILWGNMHRLTDSVLAELDVEHGAPVLQAACVYGRFSERLAEHLARRRGRLELLDIAPIQLANARRKLGGQTNVRYHRMDSSAMDLPGDHYPATVVFFLLHEQPEEVRRRTLDEAIRVTRPGGKVVIVDYHRPHALNPWRYLMYPVLRWLEPFALDLWRHPVTEFLEDGAACEVENTRQYFGGLYEKTVLRIL